MDKDKTAVSKLIDLIPSGAEIKTAHTVKEVVDAYLKSLSIPKTFEVEIEESVNIIKIIKKL